MNAGKSTTYRPILGLIIGILSLGFSPLFVKWAGAPGTITAFYRMAIPGLLFAAPFLIHVKRRGQYTRLGLRYAVAGGVFFATDLTFWTEGINQSGATNPTLLANTAPVWVGLGAVILFRERQPRSFWGGLLLALSGAVLILGVDSLQDLSIGLGTFFGLLAGIFYGAYFLVTQKGRETVDSFTYFWVSVITSTIVLAILNVLFGRAFTGYPTQTYLSFLGLGVITQGLGWLVLNYVQGHLPASVVAPTLLTQPVLTGVLAWFFLGERFTAGHLIGAAAVLLGVYIVHHSRGERLR